MEVEVLERVVLGVDGEPVLVGVGRDSPGKRPGSKRAFVLEPQVPVQPGGVVLLDDEAGSVAAALSGARLRVRSKSRFCS